MFYEELFQGMEKEHSDELWRLCGVVGKENLNGNFSSLFS